MGETSVLVVEDEGIVSRNLASILEKNDYAVAETTPTGEEAVELAGELSPDIVLMDIRLGGEMDGIDAAEAIFDQYEIPIVYLTAHSEPETLERAEKTEPFAFLTKPVDAQDLVNTLRMVSQKQESFEEERREYQDKLEYSREQYAQLVNAIPDIVFRINEQGKFTFLSESIERLGYDREELHGRHFNTILHPEDHGKFNSKSFAYAETRKQKPPYKNHSEGLSDGADKGIETGLEVRLITREASNLQTPDEGYPVFELNARNLGKKSLAKDSEISGTVGLLRNITDRKQLENNLKKARDYNQSIVNSASNIIISVDRERRVEEFNPRAEQVFGYDREEIVGERLDCLYADPDQGKTIYERAIQDGSFEGEVKNVTREGEEFPAYLSASVLENSEGEVRGLIAVSHDITEQKEREEELKLKERAMASVDEGITIADATQEDNPIIYCNEGFETLTGYSEENILGKNCRFLQGEDTDPDKVDQIRRSIDNQEPIEIVICNYRKDGTSFWNELSIYPVRNQQDVVTHYVGIQNDVTEHMETKEKLEEVAEKLRLSNEDLKRFANVAAHDLKQPLRTIKSYLELLEKRYGDKLDQKAHSYIDKTTRATQRMKSLLDGLLAYSKVPHDRNKFESVDLNEIFTRVRRNLMQAIKEKNAALRIEELPQVVGNPSLLEQLFQNLVDNALRYHGEDVPEITIRSRSSKDEVTVIVEDNGIGISPQYQKKIFDFFERLHPDDRYEGLGLGLSMCKKIVNLHDGQIDLESETGEGSTFYVKLPTQKKHESLENKTLEGRTMRSEKN